MKKLILLLGFLLSGCGLSNGLSNEEIIKQTKFCHQNQMKAAAYVNALTLNITKIQCEPINNVKTT